jgi:hypothetical protein
MPARSGTHETPCNLASAFAVSIHPLTFHVANPLHKCNYLQIDKATTSEHNGAQLGRVTF